MKQTILNLLQGNKTLMTINSMIIQNQIMIQKKNKKKTYNTEIDYTDAYSLVRGHITVIAVPATQVAFRNCTPFTK